MFYIVIMDGQTYFQFLNSLSAPYIFIRNLIQIEIYLHFISTKYLCSGRNLTSIRIVTRVLLRKNTRRRSEALPEPPQPKNSYTITLALKTSLSPESKVIRTSRADSTSDRMSRHMATLSIKTDRSRTYSNRGICYVTISSFSSKVILQLSRAVGDNNR